MANALVTGAAGFIGSHLVEALLQKGHRVTAIDDLSAGIRSRLPMESSQFSFIEGSVLDPDALRRAFRARTDWVFHLAALPSVPLSIEAPARYHEVNINGTFNVLQACREHEVRRVVYSASSSAYGDSEAERQLEESPVRPLSPYALQKWVGEAYCNQFYCHYGLETVALRYFNVFGPRQDPNSGYAAAIPRFVTAALKEKPVTIFGDGLQTRDFVYVADVARANLLAAVAPTAACGKVFNIGGGQSISLLQLLGTLEDVVGHRIHRQHAPPRAGDVRHSRSSIERARRELGFQPATSLKEGIAETVEAFRRELPVDDRSFGARVTTTPPRASF